MPKKIMFFAMGLLLLAIAACNPKSGENKTNHQLLSKNIEYDVTINNYKMFSMWGLTGSATEWYRSNLESSVRTAYIDLFFKNAFAGKMDLYDMNNKKIDTTELRKIMTIIDSVQMEIGNKLEDTVIKRNVDLAEITALRFREEWTYDPSTMAISKKVLAMAPVKTDITYDMQGVETYGKNKALFWVKFSKEPSNTKVLTKRISYNTVYTDNMSSDFAKNIDKKAVVAYLDLLCRKVYHDSIKAYDPAGFMSNLQEQKSGKDIYNMLNRVDSIKLENGKDTVVKNQPTFSGIRFLEEWSFDPVTMEIQKTIVGLCPVIMLYCQDGTTFKGFMPCYWIYFKDLWAPFDGKLELKKLDTAKKK
jgi:hypothetical protein